MNNLLAQLNLTEIGIVVAIMAVLAILFSILILLVSKACYVKEDERVKAVSENLAGANCGGCGYAGCADFAKALVDGKASLSNCNATSNQAKEQIAKVLDLPFSATAKQFAVVKCNGGLNAKNKFEYVGGKDCVYQKTIQNGPKVCTTGCLGGGTCFSKCLNGAISYHHGVAVIDKALCGGCGVCKISCPNSIIEFIPTTAKVYVACSSKCKGKEVMNACSVGCIGCGLCAKSCPHGAITMVDNIPIIDYQKCTGCLTCIQKCPRKTIKEI